jgi:hypothetical protein
MLAGRPANRPELVLARSCVLIDLVDNIVKLDCNDRR